MDVQVAKKAKKYYKKLYKKKERTNYENLFMAFYDDDLATITNEEINRSFYKKSYDRHIKLVDQEIFIQFRIDAYRYQFNLNSDHIILYIDDKYNTTAKKEIPYNNHFDIRKVIAYIIDESKSLRDDVLNPANKANQEKELYSLDNLKDNIYRPFKTYRRNIIIVNVFFFIYLFVILSNITKATFWDYFYFVIFIIFYILFMVYFLMKLIPLRKFVKKFNADDNLLSSKGRIQDVKLLTKTYSGVKVIYSIIIVVNNQKFLFLLPDYYIYDPVKRTKYLDIFLGKDIEFNYLEKSNVIIVRNNPLYLELLNLGQ